MVGLLVRLLVGLLVGLLPSEHFSKICQHFFYMTS